MNWVIRAVMLVRETEGQSERVFGAPALQVIFLVTLRFLIDYTGRAGAGGKGRGRGGEGGS